MLSSKDIGEQLSYAYMHLIASRAGFAWERVTIDKDGIDGRVHAKGIVAEGAVLQSPHLAFQVKSTTLLEASADPIAYALEQKNYDGLRGRYAEPRYLALLLLPSDEGEWLHTTPDALILRRCLYWCSLRSAPASGNNTKTTVYLPRTQVLDAEALMQLMIYAAREEAR